jgi:hypothetical protein
MSMAYLYFQNRAENDVKQRDNPWNKNKKSRKEMNEQHEKYKKFIGRDVFFSPSKNEK